MLLSRVAERVYWQARYLERVENTARLLNVFSTLLLDLPINTRLDWDSLVQITGTANAFEQRYAQASERNVMRFLLLEKNGCSLLDMLALARENARTTREIMPTEAFEEINSLYLFAKEQAPKSIARAPRNDFLERIIKGCQQITGLTMGSMSRNQAYNFLRLGRHIERADMTTRIVDVGSGNLLKLTEAEGEASAEPYESILWMNILRSLSAYQMYRQHVEERVTGEDVVRFLLRDELFPRAVTTTLNQLKSVLKELPNHGRVSHQVNKVLRQLRRADFESLLAGGLLEFIDEVQVELATVHDKVANSWFLPTS